MASKVHEIIMWTGTAAGKSSEFLLDLAHQGPTGSLCLIRSRQYCNSSKTQAALIGAFGEFSK